MMETASFYAGMLSIAFVLIALLAWGVVALVRWNDERKRKSPIPLVRVNQKWVPLDKDMAEMLKTRAWQPIVVPNDIPDRFEREWIQSELLLRCNIVLENEWYDYWMSSNPHTDLYDRFKEFWDIQRKRLAS